MKYFVFVFFMVNIVGFAQTPRFHYKTNNSQIFRIRPGTHKIFHYVQMRKEDIVENSLFVIDEETRKIRIPNDGFYEITASFYFNPSTSHIKFNRGGINFGIVRIAEEGEQYIAATRKSFNKDNQDKFSKITVYPTIVYLQKDAVLAPAISSGLIGNVLLGCELGCNKKNEKCVSFEWNIQLISNEKGYQKYY